MKNKLLIHFKIKLYVYVKGFLLFYKIIKKWERFIFHGNQIFSVSRILAFERAPLDFFYDEDGDIRGSITEDLS